MARPRTSGSHALSAPAPEPRAWHGARRAPLRTLDLSASMDASNIGWRGCRSLALALSTAEPAEPGLRSLNLSCQPLTTLPPSFKNVEQLDVSGCGLTGALSVPFPGLQRLRASCFELTAVTSLPPSLEALSLSDCEELPDLLALAGCPNLREVRVRGLRGQAHLLPPSLPLVEVLDLQGSRLDALPFAPPGAGLPVVKELILTGGGRDLPELADLLLPSLESLVVDKPTLPARLREFAALTELMVLDFGAPRELPSLPAGLERLALCNCSALRELPPCPPALKFLSAVRSELFGAWDLPLGLRELRLVDCGLSPHQKLPGLRVLHLTGAPAALPPALSCHQLEELALVRCALASGVNLAQFPTLRVLDLSQNPGVAVLDTRLEQLEELRLRSCELAVLPAPGGMAELFPALKVLDVAGNRQLDLGSAGPRPLESLEVLRVSSGRDALGVSSGVTVPRQLFPRAKVERSI